jgi:BirA family biotin operon repressor/biotin-[acetyl-CoA-carboxylase] ligase
VAGFLARLERFGRVGSTQDVVRAWLAGGVAEVCVAVADEQAAGRGRQGRTWVAPAGAALMLSAGFRPAWLEPDRAWRLAATISLAMADAAEDHAGLRVRTVRLKWPNDLVVETGPGDAAAGVDAGRAALPGQAAAPGPRGATIRKLGGVLGESDGLGTSDPRVVIGIGVNADWAADDFPPELAAEMTSLREVSSGRPIDREALLVGFIGRLEGRFEALRAGYFDLDEWTARQITTGRRVSVQSGTATEDLVAVGVDGASGALVVADPSAPDGEREVLSGEITRIRIRADIADNDAIT